MVVIYTKDIPRVSLAPPNPREYRVALHPDINGSDKATVLFVTFEPKSSTSLHTHEGDEIILVVKGRGNAIEIVNGKERVTPVSGGSLIYAHAGVQHQVRNSSKSKMTIYCVFVPPMKPSAQAQPAFDKAKEYFSKRK
jgi:quercetin dioxygenase-like cupin family protein